MSDNEVLDNYEKRRIDTLTDEIAFRELIELASEVCFGHQLEFEPYKSPQHEAARVIAKLGARGLRSLLDTDADTLTTRGWDERDTDGEDGIEHLWIDAPHRFPQLTSDEPRLHLVHEARQFGQELLDMAYRCLGPEIHEKARAFREATSDEVQLDIILWLHNRLNEFAYGGRGLELNEEGAEVDGFYHPVRLSPLAIGRYPDHRLSPTCLGISIIAASFFEKAGADHLHVGVMRTAMQAQFSRLHLLLDHIREVAETKGTSVVESVQKSITATASSVRERLSNDTGFHAANLVRLQSGAWATLDANFYIISLDDKPNSAKGKIYEILRQYEESAPGLELTYLRRAGAPADSIMAWLIDERMPRPQYDDDTLRRILLEEDESIPDKLRQIIMPELLKDQTGGRPEVVEFIDKMYSQNAFYGCFEKYVLWGESLEVVLGRCKQDGEYLRRRIDDLKSMWVPAVVSMAVQATNQYAEYCRCDDHEMLEVGLPAQRIGLAVLKDFDLYCGGDISPGFWISNWASQIPVIEAMDSEDKVSRPGQHRLARAHAASLSWSRLRYEKSCGIVNSFISRQKEAKNGEG